MNLRKYYVNSFESWRTNVNIHHLYWNYGSFLVIYCIIRSPIKHWKWLVLFWTTRLTKWGGGIHYETLSDIFNFIANCYPFSQPGLAFQLIFLVWPHLPPTNSEPKRVIGSYSGIFILGFLCDKLTMVLPRTELFPSWMRVESLRSCLASLKTDSANKQTIESILWMW